MAEHRGRTVALGAAAVIVALTATAFALGGSGGSGSSGSGSASSSSGGTSGGAAGLPSSSQQSVQSATSGSVGGSGAGDRSSVSGATATAPLAAPSAPSASYGTTTASASDAVENVADGVTATRVVKTGTLAIRVARGGVESTMKRLVSLTDGLHGYVATSSTTNELGSPTGDVTLRVPVASFDVAVNDAESLGRVLSLSTNAADVTGRYVDLGARLSALKRTRSTYLTILGQARTIGATLSVQQRVDDVQQQIEELQGQLKVLGNQSADGTLSVEVSGPGAHVIHPVRHHKRTGLPAAWHRSVSRFERGGDAIVAALGPLLLALLIFGAVAAVGLAGYRGARRVSGSRGADQPTG